TIAGIPDRVDFSQVARLHEATVRIDRLDHSLKTPFATGKETNARSTFPQSDCAQNETIAQPVGCSESGIVIETAGFAALAEQSPARFQLREPAQIIGEVHATHVGGLVIAMTKLLAGARSVVILVKALPDQIGAKPRRRLEGDGGAERPKI